MVLTKKKTRREQTKHGADKKKTEGGHTRRAVSSCHKELPLSEWVESQANGITLALGKTLGLLLAWAPIKDPSPGGPLVLCHKAAPLPIYLRGCPTGCEPPEEGA